MEKIILAGDAGATKTELAVYKCSNGVQNVVSTLKFESKAYSSLIEIIKLFLNSVGMKPDAGCIGVPGPVINGKVVSTNIPWELDEKNLSNNLNIPVFKLVNDLEAAATAIPEMDSKYLVKIYKGKGPAKDGNKMVIAPGTGLGQAILVYNDGKYNVISNEGGHADFAPVTDIEIELLKFLKSKLGHVSIERVISGIGILNIYEFLLTKDEFKDSENYFNDSSINDIAAKISEEGINGSSIICEKVLKIFVSSLAELCGSKVLSMNATGGVYLCGGIPSKILKILSTEKFAGSYLNKGRLSYYIEPVPVYVVTDDSAGLRGAVMLALKNL